MTKESENELKIGSRYKLTFFLFGRTLTYTASIISIGDFITFQDKFGETFNYNKNCLISFEEMKNE